MKTLLFILCLGSSISIQANTRFEEEENVEENNGWKNGTNRSLSQHIFIRTEGNLLLLSTDKQIDDFSIQIKDAQGHIVYTEAHLSLPAKGVYTRVRDKFCSKERELV